MERNQTEKRNETKETAQPETFNIETENKTFQLKKGMLTLKVLEILGGNRGVERCTDNKTKYWYYRYDLQGGRTLYYTLVFESGELKDVKQCLK